MNISEQLDQISGVGAFLKHEGDLNDEEYFLQYSRCKELYDKCKKLINQGILIKFKIINNKQYHQSQENYFQGFDHTDTKCKEEGLMVNCFGMMAANSTINQKVLGTYSLAFIEAKAQINRYRQRFGNNIDHFFTPYGSITLTGLEELIKAADLPKNDLAVLLLPTNSIKAFRLNRHCNWLLPESEQEILQVFQLNKSNKQVAQINLYKNIYTNLGLPLYKLKLDERWIFVVLQQALDKDLYIDFSQETINALKANRYPEYKEESSEIIEVSIGEAARLIFKFLGHYEMVPEILLNGEGGSWSSICLENSSQGRFLGTNSMYEVLKHAWYKEADIAIPWNYLGFDSLNQEAFYKDDVYLLSFENSDKNFEDKKSFYEADQNWKKLSQELGLFVLKFCYKEFINIASRKHLLSTKEILQLCTKHLEYWVSKNFYGNDLEIDEINPELQDYLELIALAHLVNSAQADFYSSKSNAYNLRRLQALAKIEVNWTRLSKNNNFGIKIKDLLSKDRASENFSLWDLYKIQYQQIQK